MVARLLACWALLGVLAGWTKLPNDPYGLQPVINAYEFDGVNTTVVWEECGETNAFYQHSRHKVTLCTELEPLGPAVIRFVLAHELAHGVIDQLDIPFTGLEETAADELAALVTIWMGHADDLHAAAGFWLTLNRPEDPMDSHPSDQRRFFTLACLLVGSRTTEGACRDEYLRALHTWSKLLPE